MEKQIENVYRRWNNVVYNGLMFFIVLVIGLIPAVILGVKEKN